jgi:hypothetical protein
MIKKVAGILLLSRDILPWISTFLKKYEWKNLLITCKLFEELKKGTLSVALSSKQAVQFHQDVSYRQIIFSSVHYPSQQISIKFTAYYVLSSDLSFLSNLYEVCFTSCSVLKDLSSLFPYSSNFRNFSNFSHFMSFNH